MKLHVLIMNKEKILIFEDDQYITDILKLDFEKRGFITHFSITSLEIISQVKNINPDLIIMNNYLPPIGGISAVKILKTDLVLCDIPIILSSGKQNVREMKLSCGADEYLLKPFSLQHLYKLLSKYLKSI